MGRTASDRRVLLGLFIPRILRMAFRFCYGRQQSGLHEQHRGIARGCLIDVDPVVRPAPAQRAVLLWPAWFSWWSGVHADALAPARQAEWPLSVRL